MAGRKKKHYAFKHKVKTAGADAAASLSEGYYWVMTNLNEDFYECEVLRNVLGIYTEKFVREQATSPEIVTVNSITELCRMGIVGELSCTVEAVSASTIHAPIGATQKTSFIYDLTKPVKEVASSLLGIQIKVGETNAPYKVVPGTLRIKKQKSRTPHLG